MIGPKTVGLAVFALAVAALVASGGPATSTETAVSSEDLRARFEHLSAHGNSNCSRQFMMSIPTMPADARLQGSCCSPMEFHRYGEQIEGLKAFADIDVIPVDPYDIPAPLAAKLMQFYEISLSATQQASYDYAMQHSKEGGPCCCPCWRWVVYGGLAKHLIRDRNFGGEQIARIWDLSDGCGGDGHAH
jgi:hypothetical protein